MHSIGNGLEGPFKVTLCSDGFDISDQVFDMEIALISQLRVFVSLVEHGWSPTGLIKPAVLIRCADGREVEVSRRNNWSLGISEGACA